MDEMQLSLPLRMPKPILRYVLFKDFRGVLYCEPVDEQLIVYERPYPERQAIYEWRGLKRVQAHPYRPAGVSTEVVFDPKLCNRSDYFHTTQFEGDNDMEALGWKRSPLKCYAIDNYWGMITGICMITDVERGARMQKALHALTPEGHAVGAGKRDNKAKPRFEVMITDGSMVIDDVERMFA